MTTMSRCRGDRLLVATGGRLLGRRREAALDPLGQPRHQDGVAEPLPALLRVVDRDDRPAVGRRPRGVEALSLRKTAALGMHRGDRRVVLLLGAACEPVHDSVRHSPLLPFGSGADHDASDSATCLSLLASASLRYWCTNAMAMLPSPTAAATRFTGPERTSPHAKMPGTLVSSR